MSKAAVQEPSTGRRRERKAGNYPTEGFVRLSVDVSARQYEGLRKRAKAEGVAMSKIVRRSLALFGVGQ